MANHQISFVRTLGKGQKSHACNPSHDGEVADVDDDAFGSAFDGVGREEGQVLGLQRVFVSELRRPGLRFRLTGEGRIVHLEKMQQNSRNSSPGLELSS